MSRRAYKNPPAAEAVCEFRFRSSDEWDSTTPFRLFEQLRESYPEPLKQDLAFTPPAGVPGQPGGAFLQPEMVPRTELRNAGGGRVLRISPGLLSVSVMAPYPGWETFKPQIAEALEAYIATGVGNPNIVRIGVRYVNRIALPGVAVELSDYFTVPPPSAPGLPDNLGGFLMRQEFFYEDPRESLILTFATGGPSEGAEPKAEVILDIDAIQNWDEAVPLNVADALPVVEAVRDRERDAFEACITDATRSLFNGA